MRPVLYIRGWMQMDFYCHMIYSPETSNHQYDTWSRLHKALLLFTYRVMIIHNITYSVHDGSLLSRRNRLPVFLLAPLECCFLHCCWSTAYLALHLEGRALPHLPPTGWPHFPQGPRNHPLFHRLQLLLLQNCKIITLLPVAQGKLFQSTGGCYLGLHCSACCMVSEERQK
jgi:hypothetical protein